MKKSRFTDSQIIDALKRAEAGLTVPDLCRAPNKSTTLPQNCNSYKLCSNSTHFQAVHTPSLSAMIGSFVTSKRFRLHGSC